jgi:hypothetical protein
MKYLLPLITTLFCSYVCSPKLFGQSNTNQNKFKQLYQEHATPNVYRTASGAPGHAYYQQKADYVIQVVLDDNKQRITGEETITYHNNSPDELAYLWVQLDQNVRAQNSDRKLTRSTTNQEKVSFSDLKGYLNDFDGGFKLTAVENSAGKPLKYVVNKTMMRIDLPSPLGSKSAISFKIKYWYNINDRMEIGGRSGYEYFEEDSNYLYTIAQFFPRMAVYNDVEGWQNKQFLGSGEFTLPFGDYQVSITVPSDHVVAATGTLKNASSVLTAAQRERYKQAQSAYQDPVMIINQEEAEKNEANRKSGSKTWQFEAKNVRDFAFASSRKFIWDAMAVKVGDKNIMAMSFYPKEGNPLWEQYSTKIVAHTISTYSKFTIDYPYPVAQSIHTHRIGMEYPMICFNGGRPEKDGTYSEGTKYAMLGVIIHEVGHNFFPMIINSDERQWTWMDEGLNTFVQYLTEQEWEPNYPSRRGPAPKIVNYMKGDKSNISPIMTNSESLFQFGNNAYGKPATALNILRETILGRTLFDYAFKTYCERWKFKHPTPEDLFRTMEDASGVDLDWFWRGWFYTNDHVDLSIDNVQWYRINSGDPHVEKGIDRELEEAEPKHIGVLRNASLPKYMDNDPKIKDFYTTYDPNEVTLLDEEKYKNFTEKLDGAELEMLSLDYNFYQIDFSALGGLVMPLLLEFRFIDGSKDSVYIPAEIWRYNSKNVSKVFHFKKELKSVTLDPHLETADVDMSNNYWPPRSILNRFELYKRNNNKSEENPMQKKIEEKQKE